jgi:hypothetical protein
MANPIRRGIAVTLTIDPDARELLRALAGNARGHGQLVSELIRQEVVRRETRKELRQQIAEEVLRALG